MPHSPEEKKKVLARVKRVRGQIEALELALERGDDCSPVLQQVAAIRGAVNGLMAGILESHLREELMSADSSTQSRAASIDDAVSLIRTYLR